MNRFRKPLRLSLAVVTAGTLAVGTAAGATAGPPAATTTAPASGTDQAVEFTFDFGTPQSPVADGFVRVDHENIYTEEAGFGIVDNPGLASRDRSTGDDALAGDFVLGAQWEFGVDVPDGRYDVEVWAGDTLAGTSSVRTTIELEGEESGHVRPAKEAVASEVFSADVTDGQLSVGVTGAGNGYVNGLRVTRTGDAGAVEPEPTEPPDETDPAAIAAPQSLRVAHVADGAIAMRWNEVPAAEGYILTRADAVDGEYVEVARSGEREVFATDEAADTSGLNYYRVHTIADDGSSAASAAAVVPALGAEAPDLPEGGTLRLDFGPGAVAGGHQGVDASTAYDVETRLGFVDPSAVTGADHGGDDALRADSVTVSGTEFVADLPNGDYTIGVVAGSAEAATDISITAERMLKVAPVEKSAGEFHEMEFDLSLVDGQLNLEFAGDAANLAGLTITRRGEREAGAEPTVYITGDSTVQTYRDDFAPQAGWGQMIERFLSDDVVVDNHAIGGRSSKNFISQGRLDTVLGQIRPGDYLFVQFGHNDNSYGVDDRYAAPADYRNYLRTYVDGAIQRGATPILVTPVSRRSVDEATGEFNVSFPAYVREATELAAETGSALVDLSASSRGYLNEIGPEEAKSVFLWVPAGVYPNRPNGTQDDTHFQEYGAIAMARLIAQDIEQLDVPLADQVRDVEPPAEVPAAPAGVVASNVSATGATLSWNEVDGADIYKVYGKETSAGENEYALLTTSTVPLANVTALEQGIAYDLRVVAVNGRGDSDPSAAVNITTKAPLHKFDFQLSGHATLEGYTAFEETTVYSEELGYGFTDAVPGGRDRGTDFDPTPTDLQRDFVLPSADTPIAVDVPDGSYAVEVIWGDMIGTARLGVTIEGEDFGSSTAGRGGTSSRILQPIVVRDGQLNIEASGWLNGLEITPLMYAPTGLTAGDVAIDGRDVSVPLSWNATDDAVGYRIYRQAAGADARTAIADTEAAEFVDTTADVGLVYTYTVVGLDAAGGESVPSTELEVTTIDETVATAPVPENLTVGEVGKNSVELTWNVVDEALFYHLYRAEPGGELVLVDRSDEPTYTDTDVLTTIEYTYAVASVNAGGASELSESVTSPAETKLERQAERINRAPVAAQSDGGVYVGWPLLGGDETDAGFHVYRDGERITEAPVTDSTNFVDSDGTAGSTYRLSTVSDDASDGSGKGHGKAKGKEKNKDKGKGKKKGHDKHADEGSGEYWASAEFGVWDGQTLDIPLNTPDDAYSKDGQPFSYRANDVSVGDVDGDGEYEYIVKWDPSNSQDNSRSGYTGNVYVDAYELDGTQLWRIDLGHNIRAGAHYTQFQVFDYDGDGKAEVVMKTADGTVDGAGEIIGDSRADYRNSDGRVLTGPEYLTVFSGATGEAIDTIDYVPARGDVGSWGDTYGNRVDRFLAGTAYLDGESPSAVFSRGYYTRTVVAAFDFDGEKLSERWVFDSDVAGKEFAGQGNHSLSINDVDGDQKDEILFGSLTIDDDGTVLYNTGLGHGDAQHVSDFDPSRPGMEVFSAHEDMGRSGNRGLTMRDAATGEILWDTPATQDIGRAAMGDIDPRHAGAEGWGIGGDGSWNSKVGYLMSASGELISETIPAANFLTFWDGDLLREIGDHDYDAEAGAGVPTIAKWNWETEQADEIYRAEGTLTNNSTKGNFALQADLFGDWREEIITRTEDSSALRIATTTIETEERLFTLMSDSQYRLSVAWQNTGYNQPPHTSYFIGKDMEEPEAPRLAFTADAPEVEEVSAR
ncbi:fibronectin type III domain-containing protein [Zhihengliuella halotolerans]|uniref:Fibronectin type 3 domain-containing protein n=1 Tax=Zhihengliuella halotolerans TaxID=370736 RepID=A0A4Q8AFQ2_9MICC|nr:fibronectin type 3 domain-containing protein [Zhihengliuella halotolerans]